MVVEGAWKENGESYAPPAGDVGSSAPAADAAAPAAIASPDEYLDIESGPMVMGPRPCPERKDKDNSGRCCSLEAAGPNKEDPDPGGKAWVVE